MFFRFLKILINRTMQRIEDIYLMTEDAVISLSGITREQLYACRSERCVTARVVLVDALVQIGFSEGDIVCLSGMSQQRVNSLKNSARYRLMGLRGKMMKEEVGRMVDEAMG